MKAISRDWSWKPDPLARKAVKRGDKAFSTKAMRERVAKQSLKAGETCEAGRSKGRADVTK